MAGEENLQSVRDCLCALGRNPKEDDVEQVARSLTGLRSCEMDAATTMGFGLIVQTWRNTGLSDARAREMALTQLALMVIEGDLQIADNIVIVTEQGRRWQARQTTGG